MKSIRRVFIAALCAAELIGTASTVYAQAPLRKIGELELSVLGLTAAPDPLTATVPKNIASGIRVLVKGGAGPIAPADLTRFLGADVQVQAELSGPGLAGSVTLSAHIPGQPLAADPLLLRLPALTTAGDYVISNIRLAAGGRPVLDVTPSRVPLKVIEQVLNTSVKTRPLTLQEIKDKGIVIDRNDYLGFEFTLGIKLESKAVTVQLPVVFDRQGVPLPIPLSGVSEGSRESARLPELPPIIPVMIDLETGVRDALKISFPDTIVDVKIPALLVIPGNVGYLKQFFSAQLFVANGSPAGSNLSVHDVTGTILMPTGADGVGGTADDPLALPATTRGPQSVTRSVKAVGPDGVPDTSDDVGSLNPGEQGQAEFLLRGEKEGFHTINFDINATLEGLPIGPVPVKGKASGGILVRNPFFDLSFAVPSIVRKGEKFKVGVTVSNIGQGAANDVHLSLEHSPVTLTQTWINRVLGGDNRLFRSLTYDDDPDAPRGRVPLPIHFAAAAACLPFAVLVSLWLARRGTGDTYGAYFRRLVAPS